jgi:hypothetical protein
MRLPQEAGIYEYEIEVFTRKLRELCFGSKIHEIPSSPDVMADHGGTFCEGRLGFLTLARPSRLLGLHSLDCCWVSSLK